VRDRYRTTDAAGPASAPHGGSEEPLEAGRYWRALRDNWLLVALIVVPMTLLVLVLSLILPRTYTASARIVLEDVPGLQSDSVESVQRRLATLQTLVTTRDVLTRAGRRVPGEDADSLEDKVSASVDPNANLISVAASDHSADQAAAIANAVTNAFLQKRRQAERDRLARARAVLVATLRRLRNSEVAASRVEAQAVRERLSELSVSEATIGSDLQLAQPARPPSEASSPKPVRNTVFALLASIFLAALVALARAQFAPKIRGLRELGRLTGLPVLGAIPRRRLGRRRGGLAEHEAYGSLQAALQLRLHRTRHHVVLVTSALAEEGKTEVAAHLARSFAQAGVKTLLVSADLRQPTLHLFFGVDAGPGLADLLVAGRAGGGRLAARDVIRTMRDADDRGSLAILPSGNSVTNPSGLLASEALDRVFDEIARADYRYVIVDGPPLVAAVDVEALARRAANVLLVVRLDRVSPEHVVDARDLLGSFGANTIGLVAVGAKPAAYG
jgi:tyrosine-protein kinase